jgi:YfiH family protein
VPGAGGSARRAFTTRADGDLQIDGDPVVLADRRAAVVDVPWVWLRQVHGAEVVTVTADNLGAVAGAEADALVTAEPGVALAIHTADCVPALFTSANGVIGAAHAGWKGIEAGVLRATVEAMQALGAADIAVELGPHIFVECYEFGRADLDRLEGVLGEPVSGATDAGHPALDLQMAVLAGLPEHGTGSFAGGPVDEPGTTCTACAVDDEGRPRWFSHRARADRGRQASVIWIEP